MNKPINILDKDYLKWVKELCKRYRQSQIKAAVKVNHVVLQFYWDLGKDICYKEAENKYGSKFYATLSRDLRNEIPDAEGLSERNLRYTKKFYQLYNQKIKILQQIAANSESEILQQPAAKSNTELASQELAAHIMQDLFSVPWGHQMLLIDKCSDDVIKALFYVQQVVENGWSRNVLHNYIDSSLYERQGKALSNFTRTLPEVGSDLAQEITRDPYNFAFTGITKPYNERILKDALLNNITKFLTELGTGFAYVGKEYRLQIGEKENFIDLLFYNLNLSCYIVLDLLCCAQHKTSTATRQRSPRWKNNISTLLSLPLYSNTCWLPMKVKPLPSSIRKRVIAFTRRSSSSSSRMGLVTPKKPRL